MWAFRSIVTTRPVAAGKVVVQDDIWSKRPGTGISPNHIDKLVDMKIKKKVLKDQQLRWDDFE